ncbi:uncharacterized protein F4807DRAFT_468680 [Annulohypoxylon truncatum]|uniref:uncharacterized protein n=1 Tax=Annulohypoxylon truncatum TaxID=327061 RepID=UPI002007F484|nr:uncharacterized protein F4807DRAFT_468680 [Annulohypoxylon truncatum]KAI1208417.1 hypothetical protein F4807DRAFT_468680 [Annulohypoxylon truncatum]
MFSSSTQSDGRLMRRLSILPERESEIATTENPEDQNTARKIELSEGRGFLLIGPTNQYRVDYVYGNSIKYRNLAGRYLTKAKGFWVVFFDGMRWYPPVRDEVIQIKFGPGTSHYVPRFINKQGDVLGSYMTVPELRHGPLFSFIPRNRPIWDSHLTTSSFYDILQVSSQSQVYVKECREEMMVIPNGRMMVWYTGSSGEPPMHCWNMLRQHFQRINTPEPLEHHPNAERAQDAEVPRSIRQIAQEIGALF